MQVGDQQPKLWTNVQTYVMAAICLVLGVAVGYLVHAPATAGSDFSPNAVAPAQPAPSKMPTAFDLKRMADKQAEPLIAELQKDPKNPDLLAQIGRAYLAAQQYQTAEQYYQQSIAIEATADTLNEMSFVSYSLGDIDKAIELLARGRKMDPKNTKLLYNLGMFEWHGKSDPKAAIEAWRELLRVSPNDPKREQVEKMIAQAKQHLNLPPGAKTDKPAM
jgi:cytochrome c-type biogenesis protein CcmH/NrfG